jgi:hypothetical protein
MRIPQRLWFLPVAVLAALAWSNRLGAQEPPDPRVLRGPVIGFVHDRSAGIRPVLGIPGAATIGPPVFARAGVRSLVLAPGGDYGIAVLARGGQVAMVRNLGSAPGAAVLDVPAGPARIAFSPSGDAAALYYAETARVEVITGLPDSPVPAWDFDLAGMQGGVATLAVSDGGTALLIAEAGEPAAIWLAAPEAGRRYLYAALASPVLAFLSRGEDAVIADGATSLVVLVRDPKGEPRISVIGGPAEGVSQPVAIAATGDNRRVLVANAEPAGVVSLELSGGEPLRLSCACAPATLERMAGGSFFRLNEPGNGPVWVLDASGAAPRIVFVPDQTPARRRAGRASPLAAGSARAPAAGLVIGTDSVLPWATIQVPYSVTLEVSGGTPPYTWSLVSGALPQGVALDAAGLLSGTPVQGGAFYFTVSVSDGSGQSASKGFSLLVVLPRAPTVSITGLPDTVDPAKQPQFDVQLSSEYPLDITGYISLTFNPNAVNWSDDPAIQFSTGGRILNFTIPAGRTSPSWSSPPALQTGTVAGQIKLTLQYWAAGQNLTPTFAPARYLTVARAAPQIESVEVAKTSGGFQLLIAGYSTPREVTKADFTFTASQAGKSETISVTVDVASHFTTWYTSEASMEYGSAFLYTQPFTVKGNVSDIQSVSVTLSSSAGTSAAASASF